MSHPRQPVYRQIIRGAGFSMVGLLILTVLACLHGTISLMQMNLLPDAEIRRAGLKLNPGLTTAEVRALFGQGPDHVCRYRKMRIEYYDTFRRRAEELPALAAGDIASADKLPYWYGAYRLGFVQDELMAFSRNGESGSVQTAYGTFTVGSAIQALPAPVLEAIASGLPSPIAMPLEPWDMPW